MTATPSTGPTSRAPDRPSGLADNPDIAPAIVSALEQSDDMLLVLDAAEGGLRIVASNAEAQRVIGCSAEALMGRDFASVADPDANPVELEAVLQAARDGTSRQGQLRCRSDAGSPFWFGLHLLPTHEAGGRRFLMLGRDITVRVREREQEEAIQGLLAKVFVTVDVPVYILDPQDRFLMTNPALDRLLEIRAGELNGRPAIEQFSASSRADILAARAKQDRDSQDYSLVVTMLKPDGTELPCRATGVVIARSGSPRFRVVTVRPEPTLRLVSGGRIQLVGLEDVRATLGPKWESVRERAMTTAEHVIRRALRPQDTFSQTADQGFLVCFADASEEEATFRAAALAREICRRLIGQGEAPEVAHVFAAAAALPPAADTMPAKDLSRLIQDRVTQHLLSIQEAARQRLTEALEHARYAVETVRTQGRDEAAGTLVHLPPELEHAHAAAVAVLPPAETEALNLDVMLLELAHEYAMETAAQNATSFIFVPLGPEVGMVRRHMRGCVDACMGFGEQIRQRLVFLLEARSSSGHHQLYDALTRLRPFCRSIGIGLDGLEVGDLDLRGQGIGIVLVRAAALREAGAANKARVRLSSLHALRCRVVVRGAGPEEAAGLFELGVDLVATDPG